jgi:hypothetical protein
LDAVAVGVAENVAAAERLGLWVVAADQVACGLVPRVAVGAAVADDVAVEEAVAVVEALAVAVADAVCVAARVAKPLT